LSNNVGATLVVGGGIAGIQAALDLADAEFKVYLLDESPSIGGTMAQLDKTFPTNDCAMCILAPKLVSAGRHANIQLITNAKLEEVSGEAGKFKVKIVKKPRYVNEEKCTGCGACAQHCPIEVPNEFDERLGIRKAIYVPFPQAVPLKYAVDEENCLKCRLCEKVCKPKAVDFNQKPETIDLDVGAIILAPGFEEFDPRLKSMYGYGRYLNVVSSIEFERILSASGPYGGKVLRPSDGAVPWRIAFIQCVGSRDALVGNNYCSSVCCMYALKEAVIAREHVPSTPGVQCTIFFMDMRAFGKEFDAYYNRAKEEYGIKFVRSRASSIHEIPETQNLIVRYVEEETPKDEEFDLVVLSVGMRPPKRAVELAKIFGIELNKYNFCATNTFSPVETSRPGIFVCGAFASPKDIPESVAQASGAAAKAGGIIASERGKLTVKKEYPPERDVLSEEPRIGVFVCHCGINIGGVVNVPEVTEYAKTLPYVAYAEANLYTCSQDTQKLISEKIQQNRLNRVIVASCTPRTHEPLFRETVQEAGLNPYLFEMVNIRDQCSWVHMHEPKEATEKAKDLVRSVVAKAKLLQPLQKPEITVTPIGLIIGGGVSGMTAALELAKQGFEVHLVEREKELGGHLRNIHYLLEGDEDPGEKLNSLVQAVLGNDKIHVYFESEVADISGFVGNFKAKIEGPAGAKQIEHGIVIVATGATEYKPTEYLYGQNSRVLTQHELEEKLANSQFNAKTVIMIQCVGARNKENPNCARICCGQAIKNALKIKETSPETDVYVLFKDMRTYGFKEDHYREASNKGVLFINYEDERKPQVANENGKLMLTFWEPIIKQEVQIEPDFVVLSAATIPNPDNKHIAELLKVPLNKDGFFLEAHMKLRPVDFATEGIFLCGMAHSPKYIDECIAQACAAASRAMTILSKPTLEMEGIIANVTEDLCSGCRICEHLCAYGAIEILQKDEKLTAHVIEALCKGCGVCGTACPTKAIKMGHFTTEEILAQIQAALVEVKA
jgi:heterodisulfide reductase subunit A